MIFDKQNDDVKKNLELIERNAWRDIYMSASFETAKELGISIKSFGSADSAVVSNIDVLAINRTLGFAYPEDLNEIMLSEIINEYRINKVPRFFLQIPPEFINKNIENLLAKNGFNFYNNWIKFYRRNKPVKNIDTEIIVEQIGELKAEEFADILVRSFDWDIRLKKWFCDIIIKRNLKKNNWLFYLGYYKHKPVAAASLYLEGEYCWLGFASTLKEYRRLGAQHALIRQRIIDGLNSGCKHFIVETAENSEERKSQSYLNILDMEFEIAYKRPNFIYNF